MKKIRKIVIVDIIDYKDLESFLNRQAQLGYHLVKANLIYLTFEYHPTWKRFYFAIINKATIRPLNIKDNHDQHSLDDIIEDFNFSYIGRIGGIDVYSHPEQLAIHTDENLEHQQVSAILKTKRRTDLWTIVAYLGCIAIYLTNPFSFYTSITLQICVFIYFSIILNTLIKLHYYKKFRQGQLCRRKSKWKSVYTDTASFMRLFSILALIPVIFFAQFVATDLNQILIFLISIVVFITSLIALEHYSHKIKLNRIKVITIFLVFISIAHFYISFLPRFFHFEMPKADSRYTEIFDTHFLSTYKSNSLLIEPTNFYGSDNQSIEIYRLQSPFLKEYFVQKIIERSRMDFSSIEHKLQSSKRYETTYYFYYSGQYIVIMSFQPSLQQLQRIDQLNQASEV